MKRMIARKIPSNRYGTIIEINTPIRFYWTADGEFDGVDYSIPKGTSRYQRRLMTDTIGLTNLAMEMLLEMGRVRERTITPIPNGILKAFEEDDGREPA